MKLNEVPKHVLHDMTEKMFVLNKIYPMFSNHSINYMTKKILETILVNGGSNISSIFKESDNYERVLVPVISIVDNVNDTSYNAFISTEKSDDGTVEFNKDNANTMVMTASKDIMREMMNLSMYYGIDIDKVLSSKSKIIVMVRSLIDEEKEWDITDFDYDDIDTHTIITVMYSIIIMNGHIMESVSNSNCDSNIKFEDVINNIKNNSREIMEKSASDMNKIENKTSMIVSAGFDSYSEEDFMNNSIFKHQNPLDCILFLNKILNNGCRDIRWDVFEDVVDIIGADNINFIIVSIRDDDDSIYICHRNKDNQLRFLKSKDKTVKNKVILYIAKDEKRSNKDDTRCMGMLVSSPYSKNMEEISGSLLLAIKDAYDELTILDSIKHLRDKLSRVYIERK